MAEFLARGGEVKKIEAGVRGVAPADVQQAVKYGRGGFYKKRLLKDDPGRHTPSTYVKEKAPKLARDYMREAAKAQARAVRKMARP
jgi:hypothetical protein